jgi:hypothetical protein
LRYGSRSRGRRSAWRRNSSNRGQFNEFVSDIIYEAKFKRAKCNIRNMDFLAYKIFKKLKILVWNFVGNFWIKLCS